MKGLILSGGKGTRLLPLTYRRAKQLIPIANEPVLCRVIRTIRDAGITDIGIVVGDTEPEIQEAVNGGERWGVNITYIRQFAESDWNSQIVLKRVPNPQQFGVAVLDGDGHIQRLIEKPKDPPSDLALVGIYMFDHHVREAVYAIKPSHRNELEITDAIQWLVDQGLRVHPYIHDGWWIDTGKMGDMLTANAYVLEELEPAMLGSVDEASTIGRRVTVQAGAQIINSQVRGPSIIGENTRIENSYIGPYTSIYHDVVVENSEIEHSIVLEHSTIQNVGTRIQDSLIGRNAQVAQTVRKPKSIFLNLGDYSHIDLV